MHGMDGPVPYHLSLDVGKDVNTILFGSQLVIHIHVCTYIQHVVDKGNCNRMFKKQLNSTFWHILTDQIKYMEIRSTAQRMCTI